MLRVHCDHLEKEVLIWSGSVIGIENSDRGMVVTYTCACGETAQFLTGAAAPVQVTAHIPAVIAS